MVAKQARQKAAGSNYTNQVLTSSYIVWQYTGSSDSWQCSHSSADHALTCIIQQATPIVHVCLVVPVDRVLSVQGVCAGSKVG